MDQARVSGAGGQEGETGAECCRRFGISQRGNEEMMERNERER